MHLQQRVVGGVIASSVFFDFFLRRSSIFGLQARLDSLQRGLVIRHSQCRLLIIIDVIVRTPTLEQHIEQTMASEAPPVEEEAMMEAVALAPEPAENVEDPFALPEETDDDNNEQEEEEPPTDTQKALESLKRSSVRLGSALQTTATDIDGKVGITKTMGAIDQKTRASQTFKSATMALGGWLSSVDSQLGVSQKTAELGHALNERVVEPIKPVVMESSRKLQEVDEQHGITRSTASTLAKGADMLTSSLVGNNESNNNNEPNSPPDNDESDGFLG